jgi:phosphoribosyl-AMP cyclohydrolase / phosphoribosyl-ATP pyrophosphohydrolase
LEPVTHEGLPELHRTLAKRTLERPEGSYTAELLTDPDWLGDKVREEAEEVVRAAAEESDERLAEEAADVLYHLEVLMLSRGRSLTDAMDVLNGRRR